MLINFALKNLVSRKRRSLISLFGVSVAIALFMAIILVLKSAQAAFKKPLEEAGTDMTVQAQGEPCVWSIVKLPTNLNPIPQATLQQIKADKGVAQAEGVLITWAFSSAPGASPGMPEMPPPPPLNTSPDTTKNIAVTSTQNSGMSSQEIKNKIQSGELSGQPCDHGAVGSFCGTHGESTYNMPDYSPVVMAGIATAVSDIGPITTENLKNIQGAFLSGKTTYETVLDKDFAASRGVKIGDSIDLGQHGFQVVGIIQTGRDAKIAGAQAFVPLSTAAQLAGRGDIVDLIFIKLKSDADAKQAKDRIQAILPKNATITTSDDYIKTLAGISNFTHGLMLAIICIVMLISLLFLIKTSLGAVLERTGEIGLLKALGWRNKTIQGMITLESLILGFLGGVIGASLGYAASLFYKANLTTVLPYYLNPYPPCSQQVAKNILHSRIAFSPQIFIFAILIGVVIQVISGSIASRRILKLMPSEAMRRI